MITRFDHAAIAVRDLEAGIRCFQQMGFEVARGGRHTGLGTENAIIRFGLDYLELLSLADPAEADQSGPQGEVLVSYLSQHPGGLLGYALASSDIDADASRIRSTGADLVGPYPMERKRPDGRVLSWRLAIPGGVAWRRPWSFLIEWNQPDDERLMWETPGNHANTATGVAGVSVAVVDLEPVMRFYRDGLGLEQLAGEEAPIYGARRARSGLGPFTIEILEPVTVGPARTELDRRGEGLFDVSIAVQDLDQARNVLGDANIRWDPIPDVTDAIQISPDQAIGARLVLTTAREAA